MSDPTTFRYPMDCALGMREETIEQYVTGELPQVDSEAFEAHYFECERCFEELQALQLLQVELGRTTAPHQRQPAEDALKQLRTWRWLATAATVIVCVVLWAKWPIKEEPGAIATAPPALPDTSISLAQLSAVSPPPYRPVTLQDPTDAANARFGEAMADYQRGDYAGTIAGLNEANRLGPQKPYVHFYLGASHLLSGHPDSAIQAFQTVVALGESAFVEEAHFHLAKAFLQKREVNAARWELQRALALGGARESDARTLLAAMAGIQTKDPAAARTGAPGDPAHWWPAEGAAADLVATSDGTLRGNVVFTAGVVGRAFGFDGASLVTIPDRGSLNLTDAGAVSFWLFLNAADDHQSILYKGRGDTTDASYGWATHGGLLRFDLYKGDGGPGNYVNLFMPTADVVGRWTYLVATWDGSVVKVYKDGQQITDYHGRTSVSYSHFTRVENSLLFLIFGGDQGRQSCKCKLDEVRLYARALSVSEVKWGFAQDRTSLLLRDTSTALSATELVPAQTNSLTSELEAAQQALMSGEATRAAAQLRAFIQHVRALQDARKLSDVDASRMISAAREIISRIET